jgi:hypothetical protein
MGFNGKSSVLGVIVLIIGAFIIAFSISILVFGSSVLPFSSDSDLDPLENSRLAQASIFKNNVSAAIVIGFLSGAFLLLIGFLKILKKWQYDQQ